MDLSEIEVREARTFGEFYVDKMENERNMMKYYFSEEIVLDWFGHTVKGEKNVTAFLRKTLASVNHVMSDFRPAKKIGFRNTHVVKIPKIPKVIPLGLMSPPRIFNQKSQTKTPKKQMLPSTSSSLREKPREHGQGNGYHNSPESPGSPPKKFKPNDDPLEDLETVEGECDAPSHVKYAVTEGAVEFHKPSMKKLQRETKWKRPCKLSVAYSTINCNEYSIHLLIYEGNMKCRRNLMKEFEAEEPDN